MKFSDFITSVQNLHLSQIFKSIKKHVTVFLPFFLIGFNQFYKNSCQISIMFWSVLWEVYNEGNEQGGAFYIFVTALITTTVPQVVQKIAIDKYFGLHWTSTETAPRLQRQLSGLLPLSTVSQLHYNWKRRTARPGQVEGGGVLQVLLADASLRILSLQPQIELLAAQAPLVLLPVVLIAATNTSYFTSPPEISSYLLTITLS